MPRGPDGELFFEQIGTDGPPVVFLHGVAGSGRYWRDVARRLEPQRLQLFLVDLLGFGRSPRPAVAYDLPTHLGALNAWRQAVGLTARPLILVGHSAGAVLALEWAEQIKMADPQAVISLVLVSLPLFPMSTPEKVMAYLAGSSFRHRLLFTWPSLSWTVLRAVHRVRPLWTTIAPRVIPLHTPEVIADAMMNTVESLTQTMFHLVLSTDAHALGHKARGCAIKLLHGTRDSTAPVEPVREYAASRPEASLTEIPGGRHHLPITHHADVAAAVYEAVRTVGALRPAGAGDAPGSGGGSARRGAS